MNFTKGRPGCAVICRCLVLTWIDRHSLVPLRLENLHSLSTWHAGKTELQDPWEVFFKYLFQMPTNLGLSFQVLINSCIQSLFLAATLIKLNWCLKTNLIFIKLITLTKLTVLLSTYYYYNHTIMVFYTP